MAKRSEPAQWENKPSGCDGPKEQARLRLHDGVLYTHGPQSVKAIRAKSCSRRCRSRVGSHSTIEFSPTIFRRGVVCPRARLRPSPGQSHLPVCRRNYRGPVCDIVILQSSFRVGSACVVEWCSQFLRAVSPGDAPEGIHRSHSTLPRGR